MKTYSIAAVLLLAATSAQANFNAGIISIDIYETEYSSNPAYSGRAVIGNAGDFWNGVNISTDPIIYSLMGDNGSATSVQLTIQNGSFGGQPSNGTYGLLFDTETRFAALNQLDQLTGLTPNLQYDLILYSPNNPSGISVNGISFSSPIYNGPYDSLVAGTDYSEHIVTADSSGSLNMTPFAIGSGFSAFQLEAIPEPSTVALVALGAAVLACRRKLRNLL